MVCEHRGTQEFVRGMATETATDEGQRPSSGRSCFGDRAGFTQQRARGSCRALHEAATRTSARVRPGPETPRWIRADPADGQKLGKETNLERTGSPGERVCKAPCGLRCVFCS